MPPTNSTLAHADIQAVMDRALANGRGCRVRCKDLGEAYSMRQRFYTARKLDREHNKRIYLPEDPRHRQSVYDALIVYPAAANEDDPSDSIWCVIETSTPNRLDERVEDL